MVSDPPSALRLNSDSVVYRRSDALLASEVSVGGLDRGVTEEELDLLQFAAAGPTSGPTSGPTTDTEASAGKGSDKFISPKGGEIKVGEIKVSDP